MTPAPEKRRPRSAAAFTLAELLVVIAVIVILVGVGIAAFSGVVKKARTSVCLHERRTVKTAYLLEADEEEYNVPKSKRGELLGRAIKSLGGTVIDSGSYKATCGGTCTVTYSDDNCRILDISCSIHGGTTLEKDKFAPGDSTGLERAEKGLSAVFGSTDTFAVIKNYFADKKNFSSLNSLGHNFAPRDEYCAGKTRIFRIRLRSAGVRDDRLRKCGLFQARKCLAGLL